mmetsp:Transcript_7218/g.14664  ORF Transcript_7218/g.14664 Transcript_7218/m.14664 type:complete len:303 (-) Transcript_7218:95-1003(-)|eukprot:CAMPEP_0118935908 /NCGR_PEP_ID=MMETSP1169-20130426/15901_1 /TAXON_ID=36882 /ORGANISM="Pyramimonas obovata, Strain CCMP722" /LENGTH=302 /DNA_ID=CAMNT_0006878989 /DNA_START=82 /DNA_END=990 /DNA_ORIENTATION=+
MKCACVEHARFPVYKGKDRTVSQRRIIRPPVRRQHTSSTKRCHHLSRVHSLPHQYPQHLAREFRAKSARQELSFTVGDLDPADDEAIHETVRQLIEESGNWPEQKSEEWFKRRNEMLTASDVSAALGTNRYMSPEKLLNQKLGLVPPVTLNAALRHGLHLEPEARTLYEARTGERCVEFGLKTHDRYPWLGGSPDGVTLSGRLLEIKCPYSRRSGESSLRRRYYAQVQTLMEVFDLEVCDLVQYFKPSGGRAKKKGPINTFLRVEVVRDREWFAKNVVEMEAFYTKLCDARADITQGEEARG